MVIRIMAGVEIIRHSQNAKLENGDGLKVLLVPDISIRTFNLCISY